MQKCCPLCTMALLIVALLNLKLCIVEYFRINGEAVDYIIGLGEIEHAHAQGVFDSVNHTMSEFAHPGWLEKVIGAGSDGAAVNIGVNNSVASRLKENRPYVLNVHCVAHRLELAISGAIKDHPRMTVIQDMLKKIHKHYHYSPKALRELKAIADQMEERVVKPTRLSGTRWVPHVMSASNVLIRSYSVILAHFEHVSQAGPGQATAEVRGRAVFLTRKLRDFKVVSFLHFMQDLLEIISTLSLQFQKNSSTCVDFLDSLEAANMQLIALQTTPGPNYRAFIESVDQNGVFKDVQLTGFEPDAEYSFNAIITTVMDRINNKLDNPRDATRQILAAARVFDIRDWPRTREQLVAYGNDAVNTLSNHFGPVLQRLDCNRDALQPEWTRVKAHFGNRLLHQHQGELPTINTLFHTEAHREQFSNFLMLLEIILVLPVSSAICERGFSVLKRVKIDWRASLSTEMLNYLLITVIEGESLEEYDAERAVHLWWTNGQRTRRPEFAPAPVNNNNEHDEDDLLNYLIMHHDDVNE